MATLLIKNVPESLKRRLKQEAHRQRRSMNQQALVLLERGLRVPVAIKFPDPIKTLRPVSGDEVVQMIRRARDAK
jgi:plasmid stability protein